MKFIEKPNNKGARTEGAPSGADGQTSAKRHSIGGAPGMTALVEVTDPHQAPEVRHCLPPSR